MHTTATHRKFRLFTAEKHSDIVLLVHLWVLIKVWHTFTTARRLGENHNGNHGVGELHAAFSDIFDEEMIMNAYDNDLRRFE